MFGSGFHGVRYKASRAEAAEPNPLLSLYVYIYIHVVPERDKWQPVLLPSNLEQTMAILQTMTACKWQPNQSSG